MDLRLRDFGGAPARTVAAYEADSPAGAVTRMVTSGGASASSGAVARAACCSAGPASRPDPRIVSAAAGLHSERHRIPLRTNPGTPDDFRWKGEVITMVLQ